MSDERITGIPIPNECKNCIFSAFKQFQPRWIPVTERLPEKHRSAIVTDDFGYVTLAYTNNLGEWIDYGGNKLKNVTAWMPLPKPYRKEAEDAEIH